MTKLQQQVLVAANVIVAIALGGFSFPQQPAPEASVELELTMFQNTINSIIERNGGVVIHVDQLKHCQNTSGLPSLIDLPSVVPLVH